MATAATGSRRRHPIDIDFLQSRAQSKYTVEQVLFLAALSFCLIGIAGVGWLWHETKASIAQADQQLTVITTQVSQAEQALSRARPKVNVASLLALPEALRHSKADAATVLKRLTELLPAEANIGSLAFGDAGTVKLSGIFASTEHVITFRRMILESEDFILSRMGVLTKQPIPSTTSEERLQSAIQVEFELTYKPKPAQKEGSK
jgi:Tfp pilus assembly protein PilN